MKYQDYMLSVFAVAFSIILLRKKSLICVILCNPFLIEWPFSSANINPLYESADYPPFTEALSEKDHFSWIMSLQQQQTQQQPQQSSMYQLPQPQLCVVNQLKEQLEERTRILQADIKTQQQELHDIKEKLHLANLQVTLAQRLKKRNTGC